MTAPHLAPGQAVAGRYTLRALLAFSAEAATYHAVAASGHEVVLKLFDPALGQRADAMGKLAQVQQQVAQLPFELVVPVADSGYDPATSAPYVVSELIRQTSLASLVGQRPLAPAEVASFLEGLGRALDACHARQLHHLALKPTNVFVGAQSDHVRVCDFGIAVVRSTSPTHESYAKSAPWWAPEQLQPAATLGAPADVFSAALLAFYALTGGSFWGSCQRTPPDLAGWQVELMGQRPLASQRAAQLGVSLAPSLDAVFASALSVHQAERPRSVSELARAFAAALGGGYRSGYRANEPLVPTVAFPQVDGYPPAPGPMVSPAGPAASALRTRASAEAGVGISPGLPPTPPEERRSSFPVKPVVLGILAALLVGGIAAVVLVRRPASADSPAPQGEPVAVPPPISSVALPEPAPGPSASEAATAPAAASAQAPADDPTDKVELTLICVPACDELLIDNEKVEKIEEKTKVQVLPGKHTIEARRAIGGYIPLKETVDVEKPLEKTMRLFKAGPLPAPVAKPCVRTILKPRCP
ncbi:MAG: protein kinase [Deltaproteobacteria bacterium]|nr:protein kinase [Deltaproteobacteria bacterium]